MSRRDDYALRRGGRFKGLEILSKDQPGAHVPEFFIRGAGTYLRVSTPIITIATMQSIERPLRSSTDLLKSRGWTNNGSKKRSPNIRRNPPRRLSCQARLNADLDLDKKRRARDRNGG
jgi:hypothetical protein